MKASRIKVIKDVPTPGLITAFCYCARCEDFCAQEKWGIVSPKDGPDLIYSTPMGYNRIFFGIHPEIYKNKPPPVPVVSTKLYFHSQCSEGVYPALICAIQNRKRVKPEWFLGEQSKFDPGRGCWITAWFDNPAAALSYPFNVQLPFDVFKEVLEEMKGYPGNPYGIA